MSTTQSRNRHTPQSVKFRGKRFKTRTDLVVNLTETFGFLPTPILQTVLSAGGALMHPGGIGRVRNQTLERMRRTRQVPSHRS